MPIYRQLNSFKRDYLKLDDDLKRAAKKAFKIFKEDPTHPSLYIHRLGGVKVWAGHITDKYVFTFEKDRTPDGEIVYSFRRIGDHTVYKKP